MRAPAPRRTWLVLLLPALASLATGCGAIGEGLRSQAMPEGSASAARLAPGPWQVAQTGFRLVDEGRRTMANADVPGSPVRALETTVWWPSGKEGPSPLLVYGHGFNGYRGEMAHLLEHLASHGYLAASFDFPLTNSSTPGRANTLDLANQPGDVRFVIDALLSGQGPAAEIAGRIDPERIGVAGLSYGGLTTTLIAFHEREADPRVKAAISIAGPSQMFSAPFFARGGPPFLMIAGTEDTLVPYELNAAPFPARVPGAALVTIAGGTHLGFVDFARTAFRFAHNSDETVCGLLRTFGASGGEDPGNPFEALGGREDGIDYEAWVLPCEQGGDHGLAMRPARQQAITRLAVRAFLDSVFAEDAADRAEAAHYLRETLPRELEDVDYTTGG